MDDASRVKGFYLIASWRPLEPRSEFWGVSLEHVGLGERDGRRVINWWGRDECSEYARGRSCRKTNCLRPFILHGFSGPRILSQANDPRIRPFRTTCPPPPVCCRPCPISEQPPHQIVCTMLCLGWSLSALLSPGSIPRTHRSTGTINTKTQSLLHEDKSVTSHVQIRGSIPVLWSSPTNLRYHPKVRIDPDQNASLRALRYDVVWRRRVSHRRSRNQPSLSCPRRGPRRRQLLTASIFDVASLPSSRLETI